MDAQTLDFFNNVLATTRTITDAAVAIKDGQMAAKDARIAELEEKIEYLEARLRLTEESKTNIKHVKRNNYETI